MGSWIDKKGSRRIEDNPEYIDYIITFEAARATASPTLGQKYADVATAGGTAVSNTGLGADPEAVQISRNHWATPNLSFITVRFRGGKKDAT